MHVTMSGIGMREQGGGGPSAMSLYSGTQSAGLGHDQAEKLQNYKMDQQQKYSLPIGGSNTQFDNSVPGWYNQGGLQPAKYDLPNFAKDRMMAKQAVRENQSTNISDKVMRTDPIEDFEVDYIQAMKKQAELADFDRYVNTLVDPKKPGNLKWLMEVYPDFVHRRIAQVHDDYDFAIRNQMIDSWGINTLDDLHFKYLVDQGKITGGKLGKRRPIDELYKTGMLAPYNNKRLAGVADRGAKEDGTLYLPYYSEDPSGRTSNWYQSGAGQPLGAGGRDYGTLAQRMYGEESAGGRGVGYPSSGGVTGGISMSRGNPLI